MLEHSVNRTVPIITKRRNRLCADTIRYITCLYDWGPSEVPKWMDDVEEIADGKVDGVGGGPGRDGRWRRGRHGGRERRHGRRNQQSGVRPALERNTPRSLTYLPLWRGWKRLKVRHFLSSNCNRKGLEPKQINSRPHTRKTRETRRGKTRIHRVHSRESGTRVQHYRRIR
jgi:hypothetical protein